MRYVDVDRRSAGCGLTTVVATDWSLIFRQSTTFHMIPVLIYIYVPLAPNFPSYTFRKQNETVTESHCCQVMHGSFYGLSLIT